MADQAAEPKKGYRLPDLNPIQTSKRHTSHIHALLTFLGECATLLGQSILAVFQRSVSPADMLTQMSAIGTDSLGIVSLISLATGAVFAFYISNISLMVGFTGFVGSGVAYAFLNELGPVLGGVAFASRVASSIAAEIGSMVVTEQVEAIRSMSVSPIRYLVAPRVFASAITLPLLVVVADVVGVGAGYFFSGWGGVPHSDYINSIYSFITPRDLTTGLIKALWFGIVVGLVSCRQGLNTTGGATGVGKSTTSSVVLSVVLIFASDMVLTQMLNGTHPHR